METETRRKGPRSPSTDESDDGHRRRPKKYDRSPSPRRGRYRRSRSRERRSRSTSRERRRKEASRTSEWKSSQAPNQTQAAPTNPPQTTGYALPGQPPPNTSQPPPQLAAYNTGYNNYNYSYGQSYEYSYQQPQANAYRNDYPPPNWQGNQVSYNNQAQAQAITTQETARPVETPQPGLIPPVGRPEEAKKEAIAAELKQQKATLAKQREEYVKKSSTLQRELEILRKQCDEIGKEGGRENNRIVKENQKLQIEIQNKMKSIHNVIDMLTGIIGDKVTVDDLRCKYKPELMKRSKSPKEEFPQGKSPERLVSNSDADKDLKNDSRKPFEDAKPMYNFVHYDPEMHWCKVCDIFPKTAKEYLNHLHSNEHRETCLERKIVDMPWHERNGDGTEKEMPYYAGLPAKRTPIKGLQFFSPATSWYCKLCDAWIGDLHCASLHLKSRRHSEHYAKFVEQNPHWETDWMADREKAFSEEKHKQIQLELQKQKEDEPSAKGKKVKKNKKKSKKTKKRKNKSSGSDSSSDSENNSESDTDQDASKSIRVAMRNKMKASTQAILNEDIEYPGIKAKGPPHWPTKHPENQGPEADDRHLLNSIRDKLKAKQEEDMKCQTNRPVPVEVPKDQNSFPKNPEVSDAWGPKEPSKTFWIKKDEDKNNQQPVPVKPVDVPKQPDEMPKPHMGFWTKQQVNPVKQPEKPDEKNNDHDRNHDREHERDRDHDRERDRDRDRERDRYKDERERDRDRERYDRRDDRFDKYRYNKYDRRRGGRDRERDYYDDRRRRDSDESPRRDRWRDSPKRGYDKYGKNREEDSKDDSKNSEGNQKSKKGAMQSSKKPPASVKGKLPFIGRLPLFKKKNEEPKQEITALPYSQSKFEDTPKVPSEIINPPGVVHITKLATPVVLPNNNITAKANQTMKIVVAPPPPALDGKSGNPHQQVVDMDLDDQSEDQMIDQGDKSKAPPLKVTVPSHPPPNLSKPPPKPPVPKPKFSPTRPPPPFVTNSTSFLHNPPPHYPPIRPNMPPPSMPPPNMAPNMPPPMAPNMPPNMQMMPTMYMPNPNFSNPPPPLPPCDIAPPDIAEIPEPHEKRSDQGPLPEDLQEALNIIFPKDETPEMKQQMQNQENSMMYASMYGMMGCGGYAPEYMDQPPPEITEADNESEAQPGPDDLRMLGIDEGDTIF